MVQEASIERKDKDPSQEKSNASLMQAAFEDSSPIRKTVDIISNRMLLDDRLISASGSRSDATPMADPDHVEEISFS